MEKKPLKRPLQKPVVKSESKKNVVVNKVQRPKRDYKKAQIGINIGALIFFLIVAFYFLPIYNGSFLYKIQEMSLFLPTKFFFVEQIKSPGGLLTWLGTFLTQFFYYPWLGSTIFIILILLLKFLLIKAFEIPLKWYLLTYIVSFALLITITQLGYLMFRIKAPGFIYSNLLGFVFVLSTLWGYKNIRSIVYRSIFVGLFVLLFYPLLGFYTFLAVGLLVIFELKNCWNLKQVLPLIPIVVGLLLALFYPHFLFENFYTRVKLADLYTVNIPEIPFVKGAIYDFWFPYLVIVSSFLLFSLIPFDKLKKEVSIYVLAIGCLVFLFSYYKFDKSTFKDENFQTELRMDRAIFDGKWDEVLMLAKQLKGEPTRLIVLDTRLAVQKSGKGGDLLFSMKDGAKPFLSPVSFTLLNLANMQLFYQYGQLNYCYHWCMENTVFRGVSVEFLKYMVKCALLNGEYELAQKYNDDLSQTMFYKDWSSKYQKFIDNPKLMADDVEFKAIQPLIVSDDKLADNYDPLETSILTELVDTKNQSLMMLDYSLQSALLLKSGELFWPLFFRYVNTHKQIPRLYQEAALFHSYFEKKVDVSSLKFDSQVIDRFQQLIKACDANADKPREANKMVFAPAFKGTYWYYFFFGDPIQDL